MTPENIEKIRMHRNCILKGDIKFLRSLRSFDVEANHPIYIDSPRGYYTKAALPSKALQILFRTMTNVTQGGFLWSIMFKNSFPWRLKIHMNTVKTLSAPEKKLFNFVYPIFTQCV